MAVSAEPRSTRSIARQAAAAPTASTADASYWWKAASCNANGLTSTTSREPQSPAVTRISGQAPLEAPIIQRQTFFFFNTEGIRVLIPVRGLNLRAKRRFHRHDGGQCALQTPAAVPFYQTLVQLLDNGQGLCDCAPDQADPTNVVTYNANSANFAHEAQYTARIDQKLRRQGHRVCSCTYRHRHTANLHQPSQSRLQCSEPSTPVGA